MSAHIEVIVNGQPVMATTLAGPAMYEYIRLVTAFAGAVGDTYGVENPDGADALAFEIRPKTSPRRAAAARREARLAGHRAIGRLRVVEGKRPR